MNTIACMSIYDTAREDNRLLCLCYADHLAENYAKKPDDTSNYDINEGTRLYFSCKKEIDAGTYAKLQNFDSIVADLAAPYPEDNTVITDGASHLELKFDSL
jgi:hypothetical protein